MEIPFIDIAKINARFCFTQAFEKNLSRAQFILGEECQAFEREFSAYCGAKYCVGVGSGYDALFLILKAYKELGKLRDFDEVIVPTNSYVASAFAITQNNLTPIFAPPREKDFLLDCSALDSLLSPRTRAIMPVHLFGQLCDMRAILDFAKKHDLLVIEDSAQAHGAYFANFNTESKPLKRAGSYANAGAFSFYPAKNLGALGDGGAVVSDDEALIRTIRVIANSGSEKKYIHTLQGVNSRLDSIQAMFLRQKLKALDSDNSARREVAKAYLQGIKHKDILLPALADYEPDSTQSAQTSDILHASSHVWHLFVLRSPRRDALQEHLRAQGIESLIHYPLPIHKQKAFAQYNALNLPNQDLHSQILSIPISQVQDEATTQKIIHAINNF
ncbi:aminotransferase [Helicobacter sp. MIT 99-10781]|uniref:DegT/DnrJ/EryC1/StrS family aminotransferase n=1 Tax=Helicobacter sp. MIT 99-10781 TaxID=1332285 RepID=UPI000E202E32|nr:DegT/DnrJ/EryC1/StrS family aminotransferase [Helicobacter sp. MIT 99-10781]RDU55929.1 aminotransferase [Helicobacter sp. MIT 99-10781]